MPTWVAFLSGEGPGRRALHRTQPATAGHGLPVPVVRSRRTRRPHHDIPGDYQPNAAPGNRAPHLWLTAEDPQRSIVDLFERGFTLLTGAEGQPWTEVVNDVRAHTKMPMTCHIIREIAWPDLYGVTPQRSRARPTRRPRRLAPARTPATGDQGRLQQHPSDQPRRRAQQRHGNAKLRTAFGSAQGSPYFTVKVASTARAVLRDTSPGEGSAGARIDEGP